MKITSIKQQVKKTDRYSIFVDGKYAFSLSESELIGSGVHSGQELSAAGLKEFKKTSQIGKIYSMALRLVARRVRSTKELQDYLRRKKVEKDEADIILSKLSNIGLLDDSDFARRWVENRRLLKPVSKRRLVQELRQKGIESQIIEKVLQEDDTDETDVLKDLVGRKLKQAKYAQEPQKLMQYLARQGFSYDDIKNAMRPDQD